LTARLHRPADLVAVKVGCKALKALTWHTPESERLTTDLDIAVLETASRYPERYIATPGGGILTSDYFCVDGRTGL
jgi:hypothetical protein